MPIAIRRAPTFAPPPPTVKAKIDLPLQQVRVLDALMPKDPTRSFENWPLLTRACLGIKAGYTAISGSITRALDGLREGSSSGEAHLGLLAKGMVEKVKLDIEGVAEINYRITAEGIRELQAYRAIHGRELPKQKSTKVSSNNRYLYAAYKAKNPESTLTIDEWKKSGKPTE